MLAALVFFSSPGILSLATCSSSCIYVAQNVFRYCKTQLPCLTLREVFRNCSNRVLDLCPSLPVPMLCGYLLLYTILQFKYLITRQKLWDLLPVPGAWQGLKWQMIKWVNERNWGRKHPWSAWGAENWGRHRWKTVGFNKEHFCVTETQLWHIASHYNFLSFPNQCEL